MKETQQYEVGRRRPLPIRVVLVTIVVAACLFTLTTAGFWHYVTRPQEVRVEAYAVVSPTLLLAEVTVGVDRGFVSA